MPCRIAGVVLVGWRIHRTCFTFHSERQLSCHLALSPRGGNLVFKYRVFKIIQHHEISPWLSCPVKKTQKPMHSYFSKPLKSCPDFSSSYGKVPACESIRPFPVGKALLVFHPFPFYLPGFCEDCYLFGPSKESSLLVVRLSHNFQTKWQHRQKKHRNMPQYQVLGKKGLETQTETQWFYCRRLQQQRRKKTTQLAKERKSAKCLPKASAKEIVFSLYALTYAQRIFP